MLLTSIAIKRPIATLMAVLAVVLGGFLAMFFLPVDRLPNVESRVITIYVGIRGGLPPEDIETTVTEPIEEAMSTMAGLKELNSVSKKDRSTVTLIFDEKRDVKRASLEVSERLSRIKGKLPKDIEKPIVARYNETDHPVVVLSATSSVKTPEVLRGMVERDLKPRLQRLTGVANVEIYGGRQRKILVEFEKSKLETHKLPILEVIRTLGANNLALVSGEFDFRRENRPIQVVGDFKTLDDMKKLGIAKTKEGSQIRLGDVAVVRDYYMEPDSYARVNNQPTVSIHVQKEIGSNTVKVAESVIGEVRDYERTSLPNDVGIGVSIDQSIKIRQSIKTVREALTVGGFLVAIVLWCFLIRIKHVSVIMASIPVAVLGTFFAMLIHHKLLLRFPIAPPITINVMSLLGIALGIGRMVDDSIVVFENILARREEARAKGLIINPIELVISATREMAVPVASSTMVMLVVFLPIIFFSADVRGTFSDVAFTVSAALIASLVMAVTMVPLMSLKVKLLTENLIKDGQFGWETFLESRLKRLLNSNFFQFKSHPSWRQFLFYAFIPLIVTMLPFLGLQFLGNDCPGWIFWFSLLGPGFWFLKIVAGGRFPWLIQNLTSFSVRKPGWIMGLVALSLALSGFLYVFVLEKEYLGDQENEEFVIFVELPSGTKLDVSDKVVADIEKEINGLPEIKSILRTVTARVEGWSSKLYVNLIAPEQRTRTVQDVIEILRPKLESIGGQYEAFVYFSEPQQSKELVVDVFGPDYLALRDLAVDVATRLQEVNGLVDVKLTYKRGQPQAVLDVDHARSSFFGLNSRDIADSLHAMVRGLRATYFNAGSEQVETVARYSEEDRRTLDQIANLTLVSKGKKKSLIQVEQVVQIDHGTTPSEVWRRNKERVIHVTANRGRMALSTAVEMAKKSLVGINVPIGYYYEIGGDYKKLLKSEKEFLFAFLVSLMLVYMVLACFFESYSQPALILLTIPLATAGSLPTLALTGTPVNLGVYFGLILLGGTVVSNAVILIDRMNSVIEKRGLLRSVLKAGGERARPIFMTSLTTVAAMLPLTFGGGGSADIWAPLAITVVSGIIVSALLTFLIIPAGFVLLYRVRGQVSTRG